MDKNGNKDAVDTDTSLLDPELAKDSRQVDTEHHSTPVSHGRLFAVIFAVVVIVVALSVAGTKYARGKPELAAQQSVSSQEELPLNDVGMATASDIDTGEVADFARLPDTGSQQDTIKLISDKNWIHRSVHDWRTAQRWNDWVIFFSDDNDTDSTVTPRAFNLTTKEYTSGPAIPIDGSAYLANTLVHDDYLYFMVGGYRQEGVVTRCKLNVADLCGGIEQYYVGSASIEIIDKQTVIAHDGFYDGNHNSSSVSVFDPASDTKADILSVSDWCGVGDYYEGYDESQELFWVLEEDDGIEQPDNADIDGQCVPGSRSLIDLHAYNKNGNVVRTILPADFPLTDPRVVNGSGTRDASDSIWVEKHEVLFANDTQEVIFDAKRSRFLEVQKLGTSQNNSTPAQTDLEKLVQRLDLPEGYELVKTGIN